MKKNLIILITIILSLQGYAQFNKAGRTAFQFLKIGVGARQAALSESGIASIQDINSVYWNPALIAGIPSVEVGFSYNKWIADLNILSGAAGVNVGFGTLALSYSFLDYGNISEALTTSPTGNIDTRTGNNFGGSDLSFGVGFARYFTDKLSIGVNVKYIHEKLFNYSTSGWALDVGSFYNTGWRGIKLAMSAQNFSSQVRWLNTKEENQQSYDIPLVFRIGVSVDVMGANDLFLGGNEENRLSVNVDAIHSNDYAERLHAGVEYWLYDLVALRAGYRMNYEEGNLSGGLGINYNIAGVGLKFDYAYVQYDYLQSPHRFSLIMNF